MSLPHVSTIKRAKTTATSIPTPTTTITTAAATIITIVLMLLTTCIANAAATNLIASNAEALAQDVQQQQHKQQQQQQQQKQDELQQVALANNIKSISAAPVELANVAGISRGGMSMTHSNKNNNNDNGNDLLAQQNVADDDVYIASLVNSQGNLNFNSNNNNNNNNRNRNGINMDDYNIHSNMLDEQNVEETTFPPPVFDFGMPRNITARTGQTAAINCRVENLGDKSVSWIRKRDLHILTAGILTYTSDERFKVVRTIDSKDWTLHVKYAQPRDTGIYECQVNTEPKISMAFRLNVIVTPPDAKAIIAGPADLYVKVGSVITLMCHVKQPSTTAQDIGPIYWYRGQYVLTPFVAHPNDAAIDLQRISMESTLAEKLQSRLRIANAQLSDSGNYTCMPTTAEAASVMVNVINDESPAAMQKSNAASLHVSNPYGLIKGSMLATTFASVLSINTVVRWLYQLKQQQQQQYQKNRHGSLFLTIVVALSYVHIKYLIELFDEYCHKLLKECSRMQLTTTTTTTLPLTTLLTVTTTTTSAEVSTSSSSLSS